jgi:hypothetical protein
MDLLQRAAASPPATARADLQAALGAGGDQIWVHRHVARLYATHVGDRGEAARVIEALAPLNCIEHRLVAAAWVELDDRARAVRLLERAAKNARTAQDICNVALGYRDAGFEDEARLLVDGAASVATHALDTWLVASCYRDAFHDAARAQAILDEGLRDAAAVTELLGFARAFAAHDAEGVAAIVARAASRASTVNDWIEVSAAHHILLQDAPEALRCLARAKQVSISPQDERAIGVARGLVQIELLDDDRPKLPPSRLLPIGARSFAWDRDPNRLLAWLRARIPRTSLDTLARPERFLFNDDIVTLLDLQKSGHLPHPLPAHLEVLHEVARATHHVDHQLRAFACTLLAIDDAAARTPAGREDMMAALVESCLALGADAVFAAMHLFPALADAYEATRYAGLMLFAELGLALCAAWLDPTDPRIPPLLDRAFADGRLALHHNLWATLARRIFVHPRLAPYAQRL